MHYVMVAVFRCHRMVCHNLFCGSNYSSDVGWLTHSFYLHAFKIRHTGSIGTPQVIVTISIIGRMIKFSMHTSSLKVVVV